MHHAYMNMTRFVCSMDEKCQVFFSIYDAREGRFIRYMNCILKSNNQPSQNVPAAGNFAAIYEISAAYYTLKSSLNKLGLSSNLP